MFFQHTNNCCYFQNVVAVDDELLARIFGPRERLMMLLPPPAIVQLARCKSFASAWLGERDRRRLENALKSGPAAAAARMFSQPASRPPN